MPTQSGLVRAKVLTTVFPRKFQKAKLIMNHFHVFQQYGMEIFVQKKLFNQYPGIDGMHKLLLYAFLYRSKL